MPWTMNAREAARAVTNTSSIGRNDLTSFLPNLRREDISVIESGKVRTLDKPDTAISGSLLLSEWPHNSLPAC